MNKMTLKKIFIVEDEKSLVETLAAFLKTKGYDVESAYNGKQALVMMPTVKPDLILLDIIMPEMSGVDFLKELQKSGSDFMNIPVVILTNLQGDENGFKQMNLKISGYFVKANTSMEEMSKRIKEILA